MYVICKIAPLFLNPIDYWVKEIESKDGNEEYTSRISFCIDKITMNLVCLGSKPWQKDLYFGGTETFNDVIIYFWHVN